LAAAILLTVVHVTTPSLRFLEDTPRSIWLPASLTPGARPSSGGIVYPGSLR